MSEEKKINFKNIKGGINTDIKAESIQKKLTVFAFSIFSYEKSYQLKSFLVRYISTVPEVLEKIIQIPAGGKHQCRLVT